MARKCLQGKNVCNQSGHSHFGMLEGSPNWRLYLTVCSDWLFTLNLPVTSSIIVMWLFGMFFATSHLSMQCTTRCLSLFTRNWGIFWLYFWYKELNLTFFSTYLKRIHVGIWSLLVTFKCSFHVSFVWWLIESNTGFANTPNLAYFMPKLFRWLHRGYGGSHFDARNFW